MIKLSPSIMCADFSRLGEEIKELEKQGVDLLHFDINDGHFVPTITMGAMIVASLRKMSRLPFEVHLQITEPEKHLDDFIEAGADVIILHIETCLHFFRVIKKLKEKGLKVGIALNPITPLSYLEYLLNEIDTLLLMTVDAGVLGQPFIFQILEKISKAKKMIKSRKSNCEIEVDGGINKLTIPEVVEAGADILVLGSSGLFGIKEERESVIGEIRRMVEPTWKK